jgi:hypothetical protein
LHWVPTSCRNSDFDISVNEMDKVNGVPYWLDDGSSVRIDQRTRFFGHQVDLDLSVVVALDRPALSDRRRRTRPTLPRVRCSRRRAECPRRASRPHLSTEVATGFTGRIIGVDAVATTAHFDWLDIGQRTTTTADQSGDSS